MNKITLIGNLTKDPELRTTQTGTKVCAFTIAVNRRFSQEQQTDFFRINAWRGLADICAKYLSKGKKVAVIGELQARTYESQGQTHLSLDVQADEVEFLSEKTKDEKPAETKSVDGFTDLYSDDLPF